MKSKLKKNDTVVVISGKDKGKQGKVMTIDCASNRAVVSGVNMVKKTMRKQKQDDKGGIVDIEVPIHLSNIMLLTKNKQRSRVGFKILANGEKHRISSKTGGKL